MVLDTLNYIPFYLLFFLRSGRRRRVFIIKQGIVILVTNIPTSMLPDIFGDIFFIKV